jgi:alkylhydroperoxidase family enzyme
MADITPHRRALVARILDGRGVANRDVRRAAFEGQGTSPEVAALVRKVIREASRIADGDVEALRTSGLSEDEIFELVVCAAVGQAARQLERARAALAEAKAD